MPAYGQSPWEGMGDALSGAGTSMARIALAQQVGRQKAQQYAQQMALERAYLQIAQQEAAQKLQMGQLDIGRQGKMDDLAAQVANNMYRSRIPGGVNSLMSGQVPPQNQDMTPLPPGLGGGIEATPPSSFVPPPMAGNPNAGPTQDNANIMNQGDLVRNAVQLMGMSNPALLERLMEGVNVGPNQVNRNLLTGDVTRGMPGVMSPYQDAMTTMAERRLELQEALGNRRMDAQDRMNAMRMHETLVKLHEGLSKVYTQTGDLDKAKEESDEAEKISKEQVDDPDNDGDTHNKGKPTRAKAAEYVTRFGQAGALKQLQAEGYDTSGYAD